MILFFFFPFFFSEIPALDCARLLLSASRGDTGLHQHNPQPLAGPQLMHEENKPWEILPEDGAEALQAESCPCHSPSEPSVRSGAQLGNLRSAVRVLLFARLVRSYI